MTATPTPEEAQQALDNVDRHRARAAAAATRPRWVWIAAGVLVAGWGVLADQAPQVTRAWGNTLVILLLVAVVIGNSRRGGSLLRRQMRPRVGHDPASMAWTGLVIILFVGGAALAVALHVPHVALWSGLAGGVLLAAVGPWWQRRVLTREARR